MVEPIEDNPLLQRENYFQGYNDSIEDLKNRPELLEFDRLIFEVHNTEQGKKLMEEYEKRFLIPALADRSSPTYKQLLIWADGFKDAFRFLKSTIMAYEERIKAEVNKNVR